MRAGLVAGVLFLRCRKARGGSTSPGAKATSAAKAAEYDLDFSGTAEAVP